MEYAGRSKCETLLHFITILLLYLFIGDCRNLQDINMSECVGITDDVVRDIASGCASLLYVNVSYTEISDASLRYLSRCG